MCHIKLEVTGRTPSEIMAGSSKKAIYGAIIANTLIAISKFIAAIFTGSSSMLSEGIHSLVDTGNGVLLIYGINRSKRKPDDKHPFGYGNEVFFWSFVVAILIFALGGGISVYEGVQHILHPKAITNYTWNYVVLVLALIFEGSALRVALKEFNKGRGSTTMLRALRESKDSSLVAIVIEDTAACIGLLIAILSLLLAQLTGIYYFDGIGSLLIGILLIFVSWFFAVECKGLLVGEGLGKKNLGKVMAVLDKSPMISAYRKPLSLFMGPKEVLLTLDVNFQDDLTSDQIEEAVDELETGIKEAVPLINRIYIEAESITRNKR